MTKNNDYRLRQPDALGFISLLCLVVFISLFSAGIYAQKVVDEPPTDPAIEAELEQYLNNTERLETESKTLLRNIVAQLDDTTPLMTVVRAQGYWAGELFYDEQDAQAYQLLDELQQKAEAAKLVDAQAEVLATRIDFLSMEGKRGEAFLLIPELERLLEQTKTARVRFYAYNLIASIYSEWERYQEALTHLLKAQAALNEIDSILNQGRRIYLINEMVLIQISLGQWQAAIETASSVLAEAIDAEYDWLAYDLLFSKYYAESALNDYEQAIETLRQVYRLADELALDFQKVIILNNFGDAYLKLDQLDKAESHLLEAREAAKSLEFIGMQQTIDYNLAFIAVKRGDSLGLKQMEEIAAAARNDETLTDYDVEETLEELAKAYAITENYQAQAATLNELLDLRKKIAEQTQQQQMNDLQAVYKSRDNAQQIALLEQQNRLKEQQLQNTQQQQLIWILAVAALIVSALLVLLLYRKSYRMNQRLNDVNQELSERSIKDPLTGLNNRRAMQELMLKRDPTKDNNADALLLLDIDHFKKINDQHGHSIGDEVLKEIGRRLQEVCRASDMVVRWGGEEFLFFVRAVEPHHLQQFASRILTVIAQEPIRIGDEHINITTTLGFSPLPFAGLSEDQVDWERVLQIADMALYLGKTQGRNRACGVTALHVEYEQARKTLENDLSAAIEQGWVELTIIEGPAQ